MKAVDVEIAGLRASMPPLTKISPGVTRRVNEPPVPSSILKTAKRAERFMRLTRHPDGTVTEAKKAVKAKSEKSARKKLLKQARPISGKKRQKLVAKAAAIADPQQREAALTFIGKRAVKQPKSNDFIAKIAKPKLAADERARYQEQLFDPDPRRRDAAWMKLTGIPEETK